MDTPMIEIGWSEGDSSLAIPQPYCCPRHSLVEEGLAKMARSPAWCSAITTKTRLRVSDCGQAHFEGTDHFQEIESPLAVFALLINRDVHNYCDQIVGIPFEAIVTRLWEHVLESEQGIFKVDIVIDKGPPLIIDTSTREEHGNPDVFEVHGLMPARLTKLTPGKIVITLPGVRATSPLAKEKTLDRLPLGLFADAIDRSIVVHPYRRKLEDWMLAQWLFRGC